MNCKLLKKISLVVGSLFCFGFGTLALAAASGTASGVGIGGVAANVTGNLSNIAKLITAGAYLAGFGFAVAAIVKFKAHKDNPTQVPISQAIALLFVGAALIFIPAVFKSSGTTLFGSVSGNVGKISGLTSF